MEFDEGTLNGTKTGIPSPNCQQDWLLDSLGNMRSSLATMICDQSIPARLCAQIAASRHAVAERCVLLLVCLLSCLFGGCIGRGNHSSLLKDGFSPEERTFLRLVSFEGRGGGGGLIFKCRITNGTSKAMAFNRRGFWLEIRGRRNVEIGIVAQAGVQPRHAAKSDFLLLSAHESKEFLLEFYGEPSYVWRFLMPGGEEYRYLPRGKYYGVVGYEESEGHNVFKDEKDSWEAVEGLWTNELVPNGVWFMLVNDRPIPKDLSTEADDDVGFDE